MRNVLICGDSYSTFQGYIPEGYDCYYCSTCGETDVRAVKETWWYPLMEEAGLNLVRNDSWSGSTIGYTGYEGSDNSETSSFIRRWNQMIDEGFFRENRIDTVLVFGGTNDSWSDAPLGEMQFSDWRREDLYSVLPALCRYGELVRETLPDADVLYIINTEIKDAVADGLQTVAERNRCRFLRLRDIDKACGHPTVKGMAQIKEQVLAVL